MNNSDNSRQDGPMDASTGASWFEEMDRQGLVIHPVSDPAPFKETEQSSVSRTDEEILELVNWVRSDRL